jgi:phage shock protein PspC (stress-responsive transcriptional regulator)
MTDRPHIPDRDDDEPSQPRDDARADERAEPPAGEPDAGPAFTAGDPLHAGDETREAGDPLREDPERPVFSFAPPDEPVRRLTRSSTDRMIGGVAGGLGRYFDVDPLLFRIGFVVLTFAGGFGLLAYLVGLAAIPVDGEARPQRWGLARTVGVGLLACAAVATITPHWFWGPGVPGLVALGVVLYLLVRVVRDEGGTRLAHVAARIGLAIALTALAAGGFAAAGAGSALGGGIFIAGAVIALGVALVGGAFRGGARWLIVPAFVLALPLGVVSAADLKLDGDWGDRTFRPAEPAAVAGGYKMGVGHMQLDLRRVDLPPGRTDVPIKLGVGELEVAVPDDVCVTYDVQVGAGQVTTLDGIDDGGLDLDVQGDAAAPSGTTELHLKADLGVGAVRIGPRVIREGGGWRFPAPGTAGSRLLNAACKASA